jgi:molybdopterin-guanine dinucleotide biosynthesis protein A
MTSHASPSRAGESQMVVLERPPAIDAKLSLTADMTPRSDKDGRGRAAWNAIVLAGGKGSRLGGTSKPHIMFDGMSLLERALQAVDAAISRVVVGDDSSSGVSEAIRVREFPRWAGPAAAIAAGMSALPANGVSAVVVLAADLPYVLQALPVVTACLDHGGVWDGWIATDGEANAQPLLAAYRRDSLARRCTHLQAQGLLNGASLRLLLRELRLRPIAVPTALCRDIDTSEDAQHFAITLPTLQESP